MDWIPSLLKHLSISRAAVVAAFVTAISLYVLPRFSPEYFDIVPAPWSVLVQAILVFSGCLTLYWALESTISWVSKKINKTVQLYKSKNLDDSEKWILLGMGRTPRETLNVAKIDFKYVDFPLSELELLKVLDGLNSKGLVSKNQFALNLFSLTNRGQDRALELNLLSETDSDKGKQ
jgi:hypothetical protein